MKEKENESLEDRKLRKRFEAKELKRVGYWSCIECTAHNPLTTSLCTVCGSPKDSD